MLIQTSQITGFFMIVPDSHYLVGHVFSTPGDTEHLTKLHKYSLLISNFTSTIKQYFFEPGFIFGRNFK